jgi:hypothetical protein
MRRLTGDVQDTVAIAATANSPTAIQTAARFILVIGRSGDRLSVYSRRNSASTTFSPDGIGVNRRPAASAAR